MMTTFILCTHLIPVQVRMRNFWHLCFSLITKLAISYKHHFYMTKEFMTMSDPLVLAPGHTLINMGAPP